MPQGDRTGPEGFGPRTGRSAGYCAGFPYPGYANTFIRGRGMGGGRMGRGHRGGFQPGRQGVGFGYPPYTQGGYPAQPYPEALSPEQEKQLLQEQLQLMEKETKALKNRLADIEKEEG